MRSAAVHIAYFISPHGFGHAARASAVMSALQTAKPSLHFDIFTTVPRWFFDESLTRPFTYHSTFVDIGLVQKSSLEEEIPETIRRLKEFVPFDASLVAKLASRIMQLGCRLVLCDIAPLAVAVAQAAEIPSVLIENFTWDWIYRPYARRAVGLRPFRSMLRSIFQDADVHIQTEPVCAPGAADLVTLPVSRSPRTSRQRIREQLGIPSRAPAVLITMGGIPEQHAFIDQLSSFTRVFFVIPGAARLEQKRGNTILLPHRSSFYHPDLVNASDAVIGKAGYSTVAEAFHAGVPFGFVTRPRFPESAVMARFIKAQMCGLEIAGSRFEAGDWLHSLPGLLAFTRQEPAHRNGADQIAHFLMHKFNL